MASSKITHILFDFDGTLVNTIDQLKVILTEMIRQNGKEITSNILAYVPNLVSLHALNDFIRADIGLDLDPDEFVNTIIRDVPQSNLELCPGVKELVMHFKKNNVPMAISSANYRQLYEEEVKRFGTFFTDYFDHAVIGDDAEVVNKKPHPDSYIVAARRFANPPKSMANVLIFEDSITGMTGAVKSGAKVVLVNKLNEEIKRNHSELLSKVDLIIDSMEHFKPEEFGLPPF